MRPVRPSQGDSPDLGRETGMRIARPLAFALALGLGAGTASGFVAATKDLVSGVLEGRRVSSLTCAVINKSGETLDGISITLKRPDGSPIVGPTVFNAVAHGQAAQLVYDIVFPDLDVAAYCHVRVPKDRFVVGNLRFENHLSATHSESPLQGDIHGKIAELIGKVEWLLGDDACQIGDDC